MTIIARKIKFAAREPDLPQPELPENAKPTGPSQCVSSRSQTYTLSGGRWMTSQQSTRRRSTYWFEYYGRFTQAALGPILRYVNQTIEAWMMRKFKRFMSPKAKAGRVLEQLSRERPGLFAHWKIGIRARSPDRSPVRRESHAGIYERKAVRFRRPTRQIRTLRSVRTGGGRLPPVTVGGAARLPPNPIAATLCLGPWRGLAQCSDRSGVGVKSEVAGLADLGAVIREDPRQVS